MLAVGVSALALACGASSPEGGDSATSLPRNDWQDQLELLSSPRGAVMAPRFVRAPDDGTMLRIALHSTEQACELHGSKDVGSGDFWWISVDVGAPDLGDFSIETDIDESLPRGQRRQAKVRLSEVRGWRKERVYDALEGTVTMEGAPVDLAAWRAGDATARGHLEAMFSLLPRRQLECTGEATASTQSERSCECIDDHDQITTCIPVGDENCCVGPSPYVSWIVEFEATRCPALCAATSYPLAAEFCEDPL
jgi:hypothetical protein